METLVFTPDTELLDFAKSFSENHQFLNVPTIFYSERKRFCIEYLKDAYTDSNGNPTESKTVVRVSAKTCIIQFVHRILHETKEYTPNFIFFCVLWCIARRMKNVNSELEADILTLQYCLKSGWDKEKLTDVFNGWKKEFEKADTETNRMRMKKIAENIQK